MKGWYIRVHPNDRPGDTTPWYSSFWDFCADYCNDRFGDDWCLSPEQSISLQVGNHQVTPQLQIRTAKGGNKPCNLLHGTSIFPMTLKMPSPDDIVKTDGLNLYKLPTAIIEVVPTFFSRNSTDARAALAAVSDSSQVLRQLLNGGHSTKAGRLCGAFRNIGRDDIANEIDKAMRSAGYVIREEDPFEEKFTQILPAEIVSPHAGRIRLMWEQMRRSVKEHFPPPTSKSIDIAAYMANVEDAYSNDAYHSLSIEGYRVTPGLIEQVRRGQWDPSSSEEDRSHEAALAANGYYRSFQAVKQSVQNVLGGQNAGIATRQDHGDWYREMFAPLVQAGLLRTSSLAGFRDGRVFLRGSRHIPAAKEVVSELMRVFFELLEKEEEPAVRIVLGHFVFVYIHPYMDGNGRIGRFLMNVMLASGGYPWTVIPLDSRDGYMASLEGASVGQDIIPFTQFLENLVKHEMEGNRVAKLPESKDE